MVSPVTIEDPSILYPTDDVVSLITGSDPLTAEHVSQEYGFLLFYHNLLFSYCLLPLEEQAWSYIGVSDLGAHVYSATPLALLFLAHLYLEVSKFLHRPCERSVLSNVFPKIYSRLFQKSS